MFLKLGPELWYVFYLAPCFMVRFSAIRNRLPDAMFLVHPFVTARLFIVYRTIWIILVVVLKLTWCVSLNETILAGEPCV
jgi:hypothetical protein